MRGFFCAATRRQLVERSGRVGLKEPMSSREGQPEQDARPSFISHRGQPVMADTSTHQPSPVVSAKWRLVISVLVTLHVIAFFIAPFTFASSSGPGMASPAADTVMSAFRPYIDAVFLNHGYFFFAPNPGPSHLIRYRVEFSDERPAIEGVFPNLAEQQPRLLYHRHFMLSEQLHSMYAPPEPPPAPADSIDVADWRRRRAVFERQWRSFEQHLLAKHGGDRIAMERIEHRPADVVEVVNGMRLDDPKTYRVLSDEPVSGPPTAVSRRAEQGRGR